MYTLVQDQSNESETLIKDSVLHWGINKVQWGSKERMNTHCLFGVRKIQLRGRNDI